MQGHAAAARLYVGLDASTQSLSLGRLAALSGSAQQHGSVYLADAALAKLAALDPVTPLAAQIPPMLSRPVAPIWMDSSTSVQCDGDSLALDGRRD
jgi:xylulokinase